MPERGIAGTLALIGAAAALGLASPVGPAPALAIQVESLDEQIRDSRDRLTAIRDEQDRLRREMQDLAERVHDATEELQVMNRQIENQEALLRELEHQLSIRDQQVQAMTGDLLRTQDELEEKKVLFARRARDLYKRGPLATVAILLAAENFSDLINRYRYLYLVALHDRLIVRQIEELKRELERQRQALSRETSTLRELRSEKVHELQGLYRLEQQRGRRLAQYQGERQRTERRLQQLARDESELTDLIGRLEREREAAEAFAAGPTRGTLTPEDAGTLDWPAQGRVIYRFGRQRNSDGTVILRQGIGIAAEQGSEVRAVQTGTVVFAEPNLGYGPSVIVSHGGGYYSLYLYLSELLVAAGENVQRGQAIGRVGGGGTPEGPHLEFQIRQNQTAVDPLDWLAPR